MKHKSNIVKILLQLIFLCIPTVIAVGYALQEAGDYYSLLENKWILQTGCFALGITISSFIFATRLRFIPISIVIIAILYIIQTFIANTEFVDFDTFFYLIQFKIFAVLFVIGWLCGWAYTRFKSFAIVIAAVLMLVAVVFTIAKADFSFVGILRTFLPIILFAAYIVFASSAIINLKDCKGSNFFSFLKKVFGILFLFLLLMALVVLLLKPTFTQIENTWDRSQQEQNDDGLLERNSQDSTFKMKDKMSPEPSFNRGGGNPQPIFVVHIDNYLDEYKTIPSPHYLVSHYFTKFDDYTETFEVDSIVPYDDLLHISPANIDLYFSHIDSALMTNALHDSLSSVLAIDLYTIELSDSVFVAPTTAFLCQPIAVEDDFKGKFKTAYHAKSIVSALNGAYFIYPSRDPDLLRYQQQRYQILEEVEGFDSVPYDFYSYYTSLPNNDFIDSLKRLTLEITANAQKPIKKILAIRDFFFAVDNYDEPIFKYSDNPGIPGIPNASKLAYFLFESRKGYCAHYAGVTLLMFRACGIPARLTAGFSIVDRSDKNKGWYWVYEDQAHAWVQAYFPGFGWLDFDTTVGNDDMEEAPQPDGTPPMQMNKAAFAGAGKILKIDTIKKIVDFALEKMILNDHEFKFENPPKIFLDLSLVKILKDTVRLQISDLQEEMRGLSLSFDENIKSIIPTPNQKKEEVLQMLPKPIEIDEFRISDDEKKEEEPPAKTDDLQDDDIEAGISAYWIVLMVIGVLLIILLITPYAIFRYYRLRSKHKRNSVDIFYVYKTAMFLLNQLGCERKILTPLQYATQVVDEKYQTEFENFMIIYLRFKYSNQPITADDKEFLKHFYRNFEKSIKAKHNFFERFRKFLNIKQTARFYINRID